jgi:bla regulator protein blaR1
MSPVFSKILMEEQIKVICWTLVHSLWTGLVTAALAGVVLLTTTKSSSRLRYNVLCGCLAVFVLITGLVCCRIMGTDSETSIQKSYRGPTVVLSVVETGSKAFTNHWYGVSNLVNFINANAIWIFAIWFLFFTLKTLKLAGGLFYINRIRTRRVHTVGKDWNDKVKEFSEKLGIGQSIRLLQSELVKIPVTVGHFKPVILIPMGLVFQLPAGQIETIILHELAHIKRRDFLVNLLQSLLETVFFFNPGLLWLSALIKEEREICCDDIVLANTSAKSTYLEALLAFHSKQPADSDLVLGMGGSQLMNRLKRIINHENKRLNKMEKIVLLAGLLIISAFSYLPNPKASQAGSFGTHVIGKAVTHSNDAAVIPSLQAKTGIISSNVPYIEKVTFEISKDTAWRFRSFHFLDSNEDMGNRDMEVRDDKDNHYRVKIVNNKVVTLKINDQEIPENELGEHQRLLAEMDRVWFKARDEKHSAIARSLARSERVHANRTFKKKGWDSTGFDRENKKFSMSKDGKSWDGEKVKTKFGKVGKKEWLADNDTKKHWRDEKFERKEGKFERKEWKGERFEKKDWKDRKFKEKEWKTKEQWKDSKEHKKENRERENKLRKDKHDDDFPREKSEVQPDFQPGQPVWAKGKEGLPKWKGPDARTEYPEAYGTSGVKKRRVPTDISRDQARVKGVIDALVKENVISKPSDLEWFGLSEGDLVVNGNKQSPELQQRLKNTYNIGKDHGLYYGPVKMYGSGVFLEKGDL